MDGVISEGVRGVAGVWGVDTLACGWDSEPWPSYVGEVSPVAWLVLVPPNIGLCVGETTIILEFCYKYENFKGGGWGGGDGDQLKIKSVRWNALHTYKLND